MADSHADEGGIPSRQKSRHAKGSATRPVIVPLAEPDVQAAARLYTEVFRADEPTSCRHVMEPALFFHYAQFYLRSMVTKDLSFIARDEKTRDIAGFIFCFDQADLNEAYTNESPEVLAFLEHFREDIAMISELEEHTLHTSTASRGMLFHIFHIGVSRKYRNMGVAGSLIRQAVAHAQNRGFRQVITDCTSPASRRVFEQFGFYEAGHFAYESFSMNGKRFFAGLDGGISLMVKDL